MKADVARAGIMDQRVESRNHARDRGITPRRRVLDVRHGRVDELAGGPDEARVHRVHQDQSADMVGVEMGLKHRHDPAVRMTHDDPGRRRAEPHKGVVELADLLPWC